MTGHDEEGARRAHEDAEWQSIVEHYGARPEPGPEEPPEPDPVVDPALFQMPAALGPRSWELEDADDRYVPPTPPPVPRPRGLRLAAWLGLFGVPAAVLLCIVLHVSVPSPLGFLALVWFVGGFGYLVATMNGPSDSGGGWGDGAVV